MCQSPSVVFEKMVEMVEGMRMEGIKIERVEGMKAAKAMEIMKMAKELKIKMEMDRQLQSRRVESRLVEVNNRGLLVFLHIHIHHLLQMEEHLEISCLIINIIIRKTPSSSGIFSILFVIGRKSFSAANPPISSFTFLSLKAFNIFLSEI